MIAGVDFSKTEPQLQALAVDPDYRVLYLDNGEIATVTNWIVDDNCIMAVVAPLYSGEWITSPVEHLDIRRAC